jgi:hypothetical protein
MTWARVAVLVGAFATASWSQSPVGSWSVVVNEAEVGTVTIGSNNQFTAELGGTGVSGTWGGSSPTWHWETVPPGSHGTIFWFEGVFYFYIVETATFGRLDPIT